MILNISVDALLGRCAPLVWCAEFGDVDPDELYDVRELGHAAELPESGSECVTCRIEYR
jgi:hypothetical protein